MANLQKLSICCKLEIKIVVVAVVACDHKYITCRK